MCLLTYFPPNAVVNVDRLECGARCNPHGHGFAIVTASGEVIIDHAMTPTALIERFAKLREEHPDSHALFHSRITTHGATDLSNCHPFQVVGPRGGQTILAHNGILPTDCQPRKGDKRSDTRILAEDMLWKRWSTHRLPSLGSKRPRFTKRWLDAPQVRASIEKWLGTGSKVLVLTTNPRLEQTAYLFNERLGDWVDGVWYSNSSYETWKPSKYRSTGYVYTGGGFSRVTSDKPDWWEEWPVETSTKPTTNAMSLWDGSTNMQNGTYWAGRVWFPHQSYLYHFHRRTCDVCRSVRINRDDYVCDVCGVCWICGDYYSDCQAGPTFVDGVEVRPGGANCGSTADIRGHFDETAGIVWSDETGARWKGQTADSAHAVNEVIQSIRATGKAAEIGKAIVKSAAESAAVFVQAEGVTYEA